MNISRVKTILFWTAVVILPGGGLLLLVVMRRKFRALGIALREWYKGV